jgi:hypothetical protein
MRKLEWVLIQYDYLRREEFGHGDTQGECHKTSEAKTGVMQLQTKE